MLIGSCMILVGLLCCTVAQPNQMTCAQTEKTECPSSPPYYVAEITTDGIYRYVETTGCPPYENPLWTNPAHACVFETIYSIPLSPKIAKTPIPVREKQEVFEGITYLKEDPQPILGALGILKNGVCIFGVG